MNNSKAFSLTEVLISIVVAAILILAIGAISNLSYGSSKKLQKVSDFYSDISYGFKLIQNRVHGAQSMSKITPTSFWVSDRLVLDGETFGLCQMNPGTYACQAGSSTVGFVHDVSSKREVILSMISPSAIALSLCKEPNQCADTNPPPICTPPVASFKSATLKLSGTLDLGGIQRKDKIKFCVDTALLRRTQ